MWHDIKGGAVRRRRFPQLPSSTHAFFYQTTTPPSKHRAHFAPCDEPDGCSHCVIAPTCPAMVAAAPEPGAELQRAHELVSALAAHYCRAGSVSAEELDEWDAQGAALLLELRAQHRAVLEGTEVLRETSRDARADLDTSSLTLKNLLYEQEHYAKEVRACRAFRSAYDDSQLELVSEADFFASHPSPPASDQALTLARLEHELARRAHSLRDLERARAARDALAAQLARSRGSLGALEQELAGLSRQADRVAGVAALPSAQEGTVDSAWTLEGDWSASIGARPSAEEETAAWGLPLPLYVLYAELCFAAMAARLPVALGVAGPAAEDGQEGGERWVRVARVGSTDSAPESARRLEFGFDGAAHAVCVRARDEEGLGFLRRYGNGLAAAGDGWEAPEWAQCLGALQTLPRLPPGSAMGVAEREAVLGSVQAARQARTAQAFLRRLVAEEEEECSMEADA